IKTIAIFVLIVITTTQLSAQEKPFRIGAKVGFPNILSGNIEFVTPLADKRISVMIDYSSFSFDNLLELEQVDIDDNLDFSYFEIGVNYYFFKEGKGLYGSLSYTSMSLDLTFEVEEKGTSDLIGSATAKPSMNTLNLKIGAKWGGLIYFRPEIGFSFNPLPSTVSAKVHFPDQTDTTTYEREILAELTTGLLVNIGFGFAF
ncbi:MAG: hypothetical protein GY834_00675, partial [Bacteroidetes bacterium]|nr:hypothetical protein [Bacteroidota bacterium]